MKIELLNRNEAEKKFNQFETNSGQFELHSEYPEMRIKLKQLYKESRVYKKNSTNKIDEYSTDLLFSLKVYEYFNSFEWFNETMASNYQFWAYICVCVVPDVIKERHGLDPSYYYAKNVRMYIPTMWWYIHMSFQGSAALTKKVLSKLNTDYILQLVERPGRDGMYLSISRKIMYYIGILPKSVLEEKIDSKNLLRRVLIQNTSKLNNYNLVFDKDEETYVKNIFKSCGVEVNKYE